jgi:hypothetical protein
MDRKKITIILFVLLVLSLITPFSILGLFLQPHGDTTYHLTYKEFHEKFYNGELKSGDNVFIEDSFSDIWYDNRTDYSYMTFESYDEYRTEPWGYDMGYGQDVTEEFQSGDQVLVEVELKNEMTPQGIQYLQGHIVSIEHADQFYLPP